MIITLHVIAGPDSGRTTTIESGELLVIGRGQGCSLKLTDPAVSKIHCRVSVGDGRIQVFDAGSTWGTTVDGEQVQTERLAGGSIIGLGETRIAVEVVSDAVTTTLKPPSDGRDEVIDRRSSSADRSPPAGLPEGNEALPGEDIAADALAGHCIEQFELIEVVGRTALSIQYRARHSITRQTVVVKVFCDQSGRNDEYGRRVDRALKTAESLDHPHLVRQVAWGRYEGHPFSVQEHIEGKTVAQLVREIGVSGMLDWTYAFRIVAGVTDALEYAAQHRIVHRGITPHNIVVQSGDGVVKLADLSLVKAFSGPGAERITAAGVTVGELAYLSPEQAVDESLVDSRTDIYNLGACTYAVLTGRPPIEGPNAAQTLLRIQTERPEPPTKYHLSIPSLFEGIILRMLEKRPDDRFQTPADLKQDLVRAAKFLNVEI